MLPAHPLSQSPAADGPLLQALPEREGPVPAEPSLLNELAVWGAMAAAALPLGLSLVSAVLGSEGAPLGLFPPDRTLRLVTGYTALALMLFQVLLAARSRRRGRFPGSVGGWRAVHRLLGTPLLLLVVTHSGGRLGGNLNLALLATLMGMMFVTQTGHVAKAYVRQQAKRAPTADFRTARLHEAINGESGPIHLVGLQLHVVLAALATVLLGFHVLTVYYF